jgi:hypothetical protein
MQMVASSKWSRTLAVLASVGLCLPVAATNAEQVAPVAAPVIRDVELSNGGLLIGRLLDANGRPLTDADVSVATGGKQLATTRTDVEGVFAVSKLRGGVHEISTSDNVQVCRLWAPGTAPPRVPKSIDLISGPDAVRGQYGPPPGNRMLREAKVWATNPWIVGGVVAAAVAIPVALSDNDGPHS